MAYKGWKLSKTFEFSDEGRMIAFKKDLILVRELGKGKWRQSTYSVVDKKHNEVIESFQAWSRREAIDIVEEKIKEKGNL